MEAKIIWADAAFQVHNGSGGLLSEIRTHKVSECPCGDCVVLREQARQNEIERQKRWEQEMAWRAIREQAPVNPLNGHTVYCAETYGGALGVLSPELCSLCAATKRAYADGVSAFDE